MVDKVPGIEIGDLIPKTRKHNNYYIHYLHRRQHQLISRYLLTAAICKLSHVSANSIGPMHVLNYSQIYQFLLLVIHHWTRYILICPPVAKNMALTMIRIFHLNIENQVVVKLGVIQTDGAGEFDWKEFNKWI